LLFIMGLVCFSGLTTYSLSFSRLVNWNKKIGHLRAPMFYSIDRTSNGAREWRQVKKNTYNEKSVICEYFYRRYRKSL